MTKNALLEKGPKNSGMGRPPSPSFGQCPKENVFFSIEAFPKCGGPLGSGAIDNDFLNELLQLFHLSDCKHEHDCLVWLPMLSPIKLPHTHFYFYYPSQAGCNSCVCFSPIQTSSANLASRLPSPRVFGLFRLHRSKYLASTSNG